MSNWDDEDDEQTYSIHFNEEIKEEKLVISHYHLDGRMGGYFVSYDDRHSKEAVRFHPKIIDESFMVAWRNGIRHGQTITAKVVYRWAYSINSDDTFRHKTLMGVTIDEVCLGDFCTDF